jgi:sigma-B regulation protein RsbU (phosphoserine phosphatase)
VTEAQNRGAEFFGKARLRAILEANASRSCVEIHDAVQEAVAQFTEGAPQSDDITLVVLEYTGAE